LNQQAPIKTEEVAEPVSTCGLDVRIKQECQRLQEDSKETDEKLRKREKARPIKFVSKTYVKSEELVQVDDDKAVNKERVKAMEEVAAMTADDFFSMDASKPLPKPEKSLKANNKQIKRQRKEFTDEIDEESPFKAPKVPEKRLKPNFTSLNASKDIKAPSSSTFALKGNQKSLFDSKVKQPTSIAPDFRPNFEGRAKKSLHQQMIRALSRYTSETCFPKTYFTMQVSYIKHRHGIRWYIGMIQTIETTVPS
jgi:hypothetical protein